MALFAMVVAMESWTAPRGPIVGWNTDPAVPKTLPKNDSFAPSGTDAARRSRRRRGSFHFLPRSRLQLLVGGFPIYRFLVMSSYDR